MDNITHSRRALLRFPLFDASLSRAFEMDVGHDASYGGL
jgi:hypothetical protein